MGDLTRTRREEGVLDADWRIHDKTHLEFAIDYPIQKETTSYGWEAYFFVPDSFRLAQTTYDKRQIYDDLLSYVRLAVPLVAFEEVARDCEQDKPEGLVAELRESVREARGAKDASRLSRAAIRRARVLACMLRASGLDAQRRMLQEIDDAKNEEQATNAAAQFCSAARAVSNGYRQLVAESFELDLPEEVGVALRWVDEDLSLYLETLLATASVHLHERAKELASEVASKLALEAVEEARYRRAQGYPTVGAEDAAPRLVEHIEFRRHMLKRFTSSVLWLDHEVRDAAQWIVHGLYALAAAVAMAFAVGATLRASAMQEYLSLYFAVLVISYAVKDRMKAILQGALSRWADRRFADRSWFIKQGDRKDPVGVVTERAGLRDFRKLPQGVLAARRLTREHALEEFARPETVLWHEKRVVLSPRQEGAVVSPMMTEIFRLNIGSWLAHTDDPNRTITFADPDEAVVCSANARRVYNINVVYRLVRGDGTAAWRRIRVVVSRKGIERIDPIV